MYAALHKLSCSIMLMTNHRSEADLIVSNASAIAEQKPPVIDPERNFHQVMIQRGQQGDLSCGKQCGNAGAVAAAVVVGVVVVVALLLEYTAAFSIFAMNIQLLFSRTI